MLQDIRFALRTLAKTPGFTAVAILSIALGIGANTAIFSLIDALMWRTLPVKDPQTLFSVATKKDQTVEPEFFYKELLSIRENARLVDLAAYSPEHVSLSVDGNPEPSLDAEIVSGNYFSLLGVSPIAGRPIGLDDDGPVAMISYGYWRHRFGLDPSTIGRTVSIDGSPFTIIGVTPPEFFGVEVGLAPDVFVPLAMRETVAPDRNWWSVLARLKPGTNPQQATAELETLYRRTQPPMPKMDPGIFTDDGKKFWALSHREAHVTLNPAAAGLSKLRRQFSQPLFILMAAVGVVLLIACANIANLLLARAAARRPELAVRLALGARPSRLAAQLLTESLLLAAMGAVLGILLAQWAAKLLVVFLSVGQTPIALDLHPDIRVLSFTAAAAIVTGLLFGLAPALRGTRIDLTSAMKGRGSPSRPLPGKILAVFQVTLSLLLLIGAGLFVRSLQNLSESESGVSRESVSIVRIDTRSIDSSDRPEWHRLDRAYQDLLATVEQIPGVRSASLAHVTPASTDPNDFEGLHVPDGKYSEPIRQVMIYAGYFSTVGIPIIQGRDFTRLDNRDNAPPVCIVNEAFARKMYPGENSIGKPCFTSRQPAPDSPIVAFEIVGVVKDSRQMNPTGTIFPLAYTTFLEVFGTRPAMALYVRTAGNPSLILPRIRSSVSKTDPTLPQLEIHTLARDMDAALVRERLIAMLSSLFGILALVLACVGLYGLLAFAVVQRTTEVGIRMALGASHTGVLWIVMRDALKLVTIGIALGVPAALGLARLAASKFPALFGAQKTDMALSAVRPDVTALLFRVRTTDPVTIASAAIILTAAAAVAAYFPARRASKVDPMVALRND